MTLPNYTPATEALVNGSWITATTGVYSAAMGDWWISLLYISIVLTIYLISKNVATTMVSAVFLLLALITIVPIAIHNVIFIIMSLTIMMLLYRTFVKDD